MAKKTMNWKIDETYDNILICQHLDAVTGKDSEGKDLYVEQPFDMTELYPMWQEFDEVQKMTAIYGTKQKLADTCARSKDETLTATERFNVLEEWWERLTVERKFNKTGVKRGASYSKKSLTSTFNKVDEETGEFIVGEEMLRTLISVNTPGAAEALEERLNAEADEPEDGNEIA